MKKIIHRSADSLGLKIIKKSVSDNYQKISFSQCGEDLIVDYIFNLRSVSNPTYMDIGAHHPYYLSNTALFYKKNCRGINIEANPTLLDEFKKERPNDKNLNIGISDKKSFLDFYIMQDSTLSTFSNEEYQNLQKHGHKLDRTAKIELKTISEVIKEYCNNVFPDFLSLDVEGLDFDIIKSIDFNASYPKIICVEASEYSPTGGGDRKNDLLDYLKGKGYYEYANTNLNAILVKNEFWFIG